MARTAITVATLSQTTGTVHAGVTMDQSNGMYVTPTRGRNLFLDIRNTGSVGTIQVKAGDNPPAFRKDLGDVEILIAASTGVQVFCIETARHMQDDGTIYIDFSTAGMAGTCRAYELPVTAG